MSDFDEYIKNKYPSDYLLMKVRYPNQELSELYSDQFEVWQHQQAIIDNLKAQLNNMEACYIEKKKQVEDALSRVESLMVHAAADYENTKSTSMMCAVQELGKALRGAND